MRLRSITMFALLFYITLWLIAWAFAPQEALGDSIIVGVQNDEPVNLYVSEQENLDITTGTWGDDAVNILEVKLEEDDPEPLVLPEYVRDPLQESDLE